MKVEDVFTQNRRLWVRLREKGGKRHEMPCHHNLEEYLAAYLDGAGLHAGTPADTHFFVSTSWTPPSQKMKCPRNGVNSRMLDCLALALEQSAAYIRHRRCTLAAYVADWESKRQTVLAWHDADKIHYPRSIAITYQTSVAQLSEDARQLFRILSFGPPAHRSSDGRPKPLRLPLRGRGRSRG
jgi:hypothetical protein